MKKIQTLKKIVLMVIIFLSFTGIQAQNAPITTAGSGSVCPNGTISVPITVTGFTQITALSLRLDFNPTLVDYTSYSNLNSSLSGCIVNSILVSSTLEKVLIVWSDVTPLTLTDGSKLVDLNFTLLSGSPAISFNNTANGGGDCEYADAIGDPLNDIPTVSYYINSVITNLTVGPAGSITGAATVCQGQTGVSYSVPLITNATGYIWVLPAGATIASGDNTNSILINYSSSAVSGNITVQGTNNCGNGPISPNFPVTVNPLPAQPSVITGSSTPCQGSSQSYSISAVSGATSYTWTLPSGWTGSSITTSINTIVGANSGTISVSANNGCGSSLARTLNVTVSLVPAQPGAISGPTTVINGTTVTYSISPVSGAISYTWSYTGGGTPVGTGTSITLTPISSGTLSVVANNSCGSSPARTLNITVTVPTVPENRPLQNITVSSGQSECYDATQTITVAGGGTTFTIQNGGDVTLIAGQNILMLPGTLVQSGGHMLAYITTTGLYCGAMESAIVSTPPPEEEDKPDPGLIEQSFKIFPNPTTGRFTLLLDAPVGDQPCYLQVTGMLGNQIIRQRLEGSDNFEFDLSGQNPGIYIIRLITEDRIETKKLVKQ